MKNLIIFLINLLIGLQIIYAQRLNEEDCKCRLLTNSRIIGGRVVLPNSIPWAVSLAEKKNGSWHHFCGASIINHEYILTASHCVKNLDLDTFIIRTGLHNSSDHPDGIYKPEKIITDTVAFNWGIFPFHDITLVKINGSIKFNRKVEPVCLSTRFEHYDDRDKSLHAWGWGITRKVIFKKDGSSEGGSEQSPVLKEAYLNYDRDCNLKNGICTKSNNGDSTCYGDSGSGLHYIPRMKNFVELVGVTSVTRFRKEENGDEVACERSGFARVSNFLPVINFVTKGDYCRKN